MTDVLPRQQVKAAPKEIWVSDEIAIDPETATLHLSIELPTSTQSRGYDENCAIAFRIVVDDGIEEWVCPDRDTGGFKTLRSGEESTETVVSWSLPTGFFGAKSGFRKRLGEGKSKYTARVEIEVLEGTFDTFVTLDSVIAPTEKIPYDEYQRARSAIEAPDGRRL